MSDASPPSSGHFQITARGVVVAWLIGKKNDRGLLSDFLAEHAELLHFDSDALKKAVDALVSEGGLVVRADGMMVLDFDKVMSQRMA